MTTPPLCGESIQDRTGAKAGLAGSCRVALPAAGPDGDWFSQAGTALAGLSGGAAQFERWVPGKNLCRLQSGRAGRYRRLHMHEWVQGAGGQGAAALSTKVLE